MFIICPKCSAKYRIPDNILLEKGQKLKCSACNHIFFKGDEAPLDLAEFTREPAPQPETVAEDKAPFSEPIYKSQSTESVSQPDGVAEKSLPEAFQPVETKQKKNLWIIPLYLVFIGVLCAAAWIYHDSLKPSLSGLFPNQGFHTVSAPKRRPLSARVKTNRVKESNLDAVQPVPVLPKPQKPVSAVQPIVVPKPSVQSSTGNTAVDFSLPPIPEMPDEMADAETEINDNQPLVDVVNPAVPESQTIDLAGLDQNFVADAVSFKVEPHENGQNQLLIEGQIKNMTPFNQEGPTITVRAINSDGRILAEKKIKTTAEVIKPKELVPFYTGMTPAPETVNRIEIVF